MEGKTIAVLKQPTASNIVRGIYYLIFGTLMIVATVTLGPQFARDIADMPYVIIVPVFGVIFLIMGLGDIILGITNSKLKEIPIVKKDGKLVFYGHVMATPLFTEKKVIELDTAKLNARFKKGNIASTSEWWKLLLDDGSKTVKVRVMKFIKGDIRSLVDSINGK